MTTLKATSTLSCLLKAWLWFSETGEHLLVHRQGFQFLSCLGGGLLGIPQMEGGFNPTDATTRRKAGPGSGLTWVLDVVQLVYTPGWPMSAET